MTSPKADNDYSKRRSFFSFLIFLLIIGIVSYLILYAPRPSINDFKPAPVQAGYYKVKTINDGDTIVVDMDGKDETVRFIGVDTPETHKPNTPVQCWGPEGTSYTTEALKSHGNQVRLEADPINTNRDRYDRLLRYVYLNDGTLLNAKLIKDGQGFAYTSFPFEKSNEFKNYSVVAKKENKGLWLACKITTDKYGVNHTEFRD
jgi:micrococcal nuclease